MSVWRLKTASRESKCRRWLVSRVRNTLRLFLRAGMMYTFQPTLKPWFWFWGWRVTSVWRLKTGSRESEFGRLTFRVVSTKTPPPPKKMPCSDISAHGDNKTKPVWTSHTKMSFSETWTVQNCLHTGCLCHGSAHVRIVIVLYFCPV